MPSKLSQEDILEAISSMTVLELSELLKSFEERRAETRRWELRIVAATHRDLRTLSAIGQFRQDLYARLSVVEILVPHGQQAGQLVVCGSKVRV